MRSATRLASPHATRPPRLPARAPAAPSAPRFVSHRGVLAGLVAGGVILAAAFATPALAAGAMGAPGTTPRASLPSPARGVAREPRRDASEAAVLPSIRRLGVDTVGNNIADYRRVLWREAAEASGFAAMPFSRAQLEERLGELAAHAAGETGRYFVVPLLPTGDGEAFVAPAGSGAAGADAARARLEGEYDLDAWLRADLSFSPDQVRLRTSLVGARAATRGRTLAREDVFLRAGATEKEIHEGFLTALSRLSATLGHDGRVTSLRDDLVTLDFGRERGLSAGTRVELGLVVLTAYHPASGEYLRNRRIPTHVVEIVDAREGSSIARVVERDARALRAARTAFGQGPDENVPLLAWRTEMSPTLVRRGSAPWERPREVVAFPLTGAAEEGFASDGRARSDDDDLGGGGAVFLSRLFGGSERDSDGGSRGSRQGRQGARRSASASDASSTPASLDDGEGDERARASENDDDRGLSDEDAASEGNIPPGEGDDAQGYDARPARRQKPFGRRRNEGPGLLSTRAGLGMTFGILETDRGDRYTDFPATVLNTFLASADVALPHDLVAKPELTLRLFSGGDVEGTEVALKAPMLTPVAQMGEGRVLVGGELHLNLGGVKTIRVKKDLGHLALLGVSEYETHLPGFGSADVGAGLSVFALLGGRIEGALRVGVRPSSVLPAPLGFWARVAKGPEKWFEFDFGATWTFLDGEK